MPDNRYLSIYLNDHLAGATVGVRLARRVAAGGPTGEPDAELRRIADEIETDCDTLVDVMRRLQVPRSRIKPPLAALAERAGRLKPNGHVRRPSPLSRLVELELLTVGVEGKLLLWEALRTATAGDRRLDGIDLPALTARARDQRDRLDRRREQAAAGIGGSV